MSESTLLMSEELHGQIPDLDEQYFTLIENLILVRGIFETPDGEDYLDGPLVAILSSDNPEVEIKLNLPLALDVVRRKSNLVFKSFNVYHKKVPTVLNGPFTISAAKICDINVNEQYCTLILGLQPAISKKEVL
jgi:hypothetical protein